MDPPPFYDNPHCHLLCIIKAFMFLCIAAFIVYVPLGDPSEELSSCESNHRSQGVDPRSSLVSTCGLCHIYRIAVKAANNAVYVTEKTGSIIFQALYDAKLKFYNILESVDKKDLCGVVCCAQEWAEELKTDHLDKVIEDEITQKLSNDLLQSIERKFQVDLEKSVDMVMVKIKMLLSNGTSHIQDRLVELQGMMAIMRKEDENEVDKCLLQRQNETSSLAEKALHEMVICGYALIGHDPAQAVSKVLTLKNMIRDGVKPIYEQKREIYELLKVCGHDHESLKKVIKCVISKSTHIKSAMMDITTKLVDGVVDLTKMMAHGAMHEACLIEVIRATEDKAFDLIKEVRNCARGRSTLEVVEEYMADNNATVLDIPKRDIISGNSSDLNDKVNASEEMQDLTRTNAKDVTSMGDNNLTW